MEHSVIIFDTTLRDGEQSAGVSFSSEQKLEIASQLENLGVDVIEAGFPCSSPQDFECVATIAKEIRGSTICGLARAIASDIEVAAKALEGANKPCIHTFINTSDIQIEHQLRMTRQQVLDRACEMVKRALTFVDDVEFSPMDATRSDLDFLVQLVREVIAVGATRINIPDSVGYALPSDIASIFSKLTGSIEGIDNVILSFHGHNDLGLATANSLAAIQNGARQIEGTINGIGERAGNTALEEVIMAIYTRKANFKCNTKINTQEIFKTSTLVSRLSGLAVQQNKAIVGKNAFRHSSGIHQDGIIKFRENWEIMNPSTIGIPSGTQLVLGKLSGRNGLRQHLERLGYQLSEEDLTRVLTAFKDLTARKKEIDDRDLESLVSSNAGGITRVGWEIISCQVFAGINIIPSAIVKLRSPDGVEVVDSATGTGPIDAVCEVINKIVGYTPNLELFDVHGVTEGIDAQAHVVIKMRLNDKESLGKGSHTDVVVASAQAYLSALNRLIS